MLSGYRSSHRALADRRNRGRAESRAAPEKRGADAYWSVDARDVAHRLGTGLDGLTTPEAARRLAQYGPNALHETRPLSRMAVILRQMRSPLLLLLVFRGSRVGSHRGMARRGIVVTIVLATVTIGYSREYSAHAAAAALRSRLRAGTTVLRDTRLVTVLTEEIVPGDVVLLSAGSLVPADAVNLEASDFFVSEAVLTGESFPVQKRPGATSAASLAERTNCVFLGTNVRSGTARCLVVTTGATTEFGAIAHRLTLRPPETEFDRGIRHFGYLLTSAMSILVFLVFVAHTLESHQSISRPCASRLSGPRRRHRRPCPR